MNVSNPISVEAKAAPAGGATSPAARGMVLPILPLRNVVVFPGMLVPLSVSRPESLRLLEENLPRDKSIALVLQRDSEKNTPALADLYEYGVTARVVRMIRQGDETVTILVHGDQRLHVKAEVQREPYLTAEVELLASPGLPPDDDYWQASIRNLRDSAQRLMSLRTDVPEEVKTALLNIDDSAFLTDFLASNLNSKLEDKQKLLEETDVPRRVAALQRLLNNQLHIAELQHKLREDTQSEFTEAQKRAYLREQLRAIQRELGEDGSGEEQVEDLRQRLEKAGLPEAAKSTVDRELRRLEMIPPASPDHSVMVNYLETVAALPWNTMSEDHVDLIKAQEILDRDHFGLTKVKKRLIEYLAVRRLNPSGRAPILCFLGPPGVGKTSLGQSIADALGRKFARISLGGIRDEAEIRGHRRTYVGSMPGRLIQELRRLGTRNPVIMLDEVDKLGADFRGDPASALLEVLDPRQNNEFVDRYLDVPFDLSQIIFIATSNTLDTIPAPLRDRMEVVELPGYTEGEKLNIARNYLVRRQLAEHGLTEAQCRWTDEALVRTIDDYTREAGVRNLERQIASVIRHVAAQIVRGEILQAEVTVNTVRDALGPAYFVRESKLQTSAPGVVTGLAYTAGGGEVLHIEAIRYPGKGGFTLTGQLGDVMKNP